MIIKHMLHLIPIGTTDLGTHSSAFSPRIIRDGAIVFALLREDWAGVYRESKGATFVLLVVTCMEVLKGWFESRKWSCKVRIERLLKRARATDAAIAHITCAQATHELCTLCVAYLSLPHQKEASVGSYV